jgi:hypothetical protein
LLPYSQSQVRNRKFIGNLLLNECWWCQRASGTKARGFAGVAFDLLLLTFINASSPAANPLLAGRVKVLLAVVLPEMTEFKLRVLGTSGSFCRRN